MSKRILSMLLAVLTTVCLFAGCAGNATSSTGSAAPVSEAPSSEETSEPAKISISYIRDANAPVNPCLLYTSLKIRRHSLLLSTFAVLLSGQMY